MNYLDENLNALKIRNENLYNKVREYVDNTEIDYSNFSIIDTRDGNAIVVINRSGKEIRLNSIYNAEKEASHWVKQFDFSNIDTNVAMFGISNGIFTREILKQLDKNSVMLLVEPDIDLFLFCINEFDMTDIISDERIAFIIEKINWDKFINYLGAIVDSKRLNSFIFCCHPKIEQLYSMELKDIKNVIIEHINKLHLNYNTRVVLRSDAMENSIKNLHFLKNINFVDEFREIIPDNIPFIIVAAGPSLDKNIDELKRVEGRAFIIVVDRAVNDVVKHGINFDAIITVDAGKSIEYMNNEESYKYPIFACDDAKNELLELNKGRKIFLIGTAFMNKICKKYGIETKHYSVGGSVATSAFNMARVIGSKKIILIGQDLAYAGELTHAGGEKEEHVINNKTFMVEGIDGKEVKTRGDWLRFLKWYETEIEKLDEDVEVIDATEGGAKIAGTKVMKLSEVIDKYCTVEFDFKKALDNMSPAFDEKKYPEVRQDLFHLDVELSHIKECAKKGIEISDLMLCEIEKGECALEAVAGYANRIKEMNKLIEEQFVYNILNEYIKADIEHVMMNVNCLGEDEIENKKETCRISKFVYEKILDAVERIEPLLKDSLERV